MFGPLETAMLLSTEIDPPAHWAHSGIKWAAPRHGDKKYGSFSPLAAQETFGASHRCSLLKTPTPHERRFAQVSFFTHFKKRQSQLAGARHGRFLR